MRKYLVMLREGSAAEKIFTEDSDTTYKGHLVLTCEEFEQSGSFVRIKRIPVNKGVEDRGHQSWWLAHSDIAAVFQYDGGDTPIGFGKGESA